MVYNVAIDDIVIFKKYDDIVKQDILQDGNIIYQNDNQYNILYLDGYKSEYEEIEKENIVAILDKQMKKENYQELKINDNVEYRGYFYTVQFEDTILYKREDD